MVVEMETTRKQLIELLSKNEETYISGQQLSKDLNISRSAVWKHMKKLEQDGYDIEGIPRKGYRIKQHPDKVTPHTLQWGLDTAWLGQNIHHYPSVTSTQTIAHQLAQEGAEHGSVIIADEQTKGRGRLSKSWYSAKSEGIWMSIILRPEQIQPQQAPQLTLLTATVLAEVLTNNCHIAPKIKWPNDILVNNRKLSGILTEMQAEQDRIQYIILGIGMNVNQQNSTLPDDIREIATSLSIESGQQWQLQPIIQQILQSLEKAYNLFITEGFSSAKKTWEQYAFRLGDVMKIKTLNEEWNGKLLGIEKDGALRFEDEEGTIHTLYSAEIDWRG